MPYHTYMQCDSMRITRAQHKRIREIVGFNIVDCDGPFTNEPIDINQAIQITEYIAGETQDDWVHNIFKQHGYKTRPLISLSMFIMFLLCEFKIGAEEQGKRPLSGQRLSTQIKSPL